MTFSEVKPFEDKKALLKLTDGEITTAKVLGVNEEYEEYDDMIVEVLSSNKPETYKDRAARYAIALADLVSIEEIVGCIAEAFDFGGHRIRIEAS